MYQSMFVIMTQGFSYRSCFSDDIKTLEW